MVGRGSSINEGALLRLDRLTGVGTFIGNLGGLSGMAFSKFGPLYSSTIDGPGRSQTSELVDINPDTGALNAVIGTISAGVFPLVIDDLAMQPGPDVLFGITGTGGVTPPGLLYTIDTATAVATFVGSPKLELGGGLDFTRDGRLFEITPLDNQGGPGLFELNPATAAIISNRLLNGSYDGLAGDPEGCLCATVDGHR